MRLTFPTVAFAAMTFQACGDGKISGPEGSGDLPEPIATKELNVTACGFGQQFSSTITNPYAPFKVDNTWEYAGEEDGAFVELLIEVLTKTEDVGPVETRVVMETEWEDGVLIEESWNYFAQTNDGTVCYFGEAVKIYEYDDKGHVSNILDTGAWRADVGENFPGIFMPANPEPGVIFQMEGGLPDVALDEGKVLGTGPVKIDGVAYLDAIRVRESNPIDGSSGIKYYAPGVGLIVDGPVVLLNFVRGAAN